MGFAVHDISGGTGPHFTFVDPRGLSSPEGRRNMIEDAIEVVRGFEAKKVERSKVIIGVRSGVFIPRQLTNPSSDARDGGGT